MLLEFGLVIGSGWWVFALTSLLNIVMPFQTEPKFSDNEWLTTYKIVGAYQNQAGADPANDPKFTDTLWDLERKWERAAENAS